MIGLALLAEVALLALLAACSTPPVQVHAQRPFPDKLSAWNLFVGDMSVLKPNEGVVPYGLNSPLFTDYADKLRTVYVPPGQPAAYDPAAPFDFPVGSVLTKTFAYGALAPGAVGEGTRLVETRLLVHTAEGWVGLPYVWDADRKDATLTLAGATIPMTIPTPAGPRQIAYGVPNANQCKGCHESHGRTMSPIGPTARNLNRDDPYAEGSQLARWVALGLLTGAPEAAAAPRAAAWDDPASGSVDARARAYLDVHCAHCHNPDGPGNTSGLLLGADVAEPRLLGRCKAPVAAGKASGGLRYDVVPGDPDASILVHRMASAEPDVMMPELGRSLVHEEGVALIRAWVAEMEGGCAAQP
ncbi:MAG: hypothetical protein H6739_26660 [Alphaproteobacteria bacterium]|nr:hypothetical protein [Alphaproteobacteria bacterium]